jgi:hypothetical protein
MHNHTIEGINNHVDRRLVGSRENENIEGTPCKIVAELKVVLVKSKNK